MDLLSIIPAVCFILFIVFICLLLFVYIPYVIDFVGIVTKFLAFPLRKLYKKIKQLILKKANPQTLENLNRKYSVFGGIVGFLTFFTIALLALIIALCVPRIITDKVALLKLVLENTVMGAFLFSLDDGALTQISAASVFAIGFSAGFSLLCMQSISKGKWYIKVGMFIFSFVTMIGLAVALSATFQIVGDWGYQTITYLSQNHSSGFFQTAGQIIALVVLGYFAVLLLLSVVEQYLSFVAFIPICVIVFGFLLSGVLNLMKSHGASSQAMDIVNNVLTFAMIFGVDILRNNYKGLQKRVKPFTDRIFIKIFQKITG